MFEIEVQQDTFSQALEKLKVTCDSSSSTDEEYLKTVKLEIVNREVVENNQKVIKTMLQLTTFNKSELGISFCPCKVRSNDTQCSLIEYESLNELVSSFPDTGVVIQDDPSENYIKLTYSGRKQYITLAKLDSKKFCIQIPNVQFVIQMECSALKLLLDRCSNVVTKSSNSIDESTCITFNNNQCIALCKSVKTKQMMLYCKNINTGNTNKQLIVNTKVCKKLLDNFEDIDKVNIFENDNTICINQNDVYYYFRKPQGTFTDISKFLPNNYKFIYKFNKMELLTSLKRVNAVCTDINNFRTCIMQFADMFSMITANGQRGSIQENVVSELITQDNNEFILAFNILSMISILSMFRGYDEILFCVNNNSNIVISPVTKDNTVIRILLPTVRVKN